MGYPTRAYLTLLGACLIQLIGGTTLLIGDISVYISSYFYQYDQTITLDFTYFVVLGQGFSAMFGGITSVKLASMIGPRLTIAIGVAVAGTSYLISAYLHNFIAFCVIFGFFFGFTSAIFYIQGLAIVWMWFIKIKSLVTGIVLSFFAGSIMIFAWFAGKLTNPDNLPATIKVKDGQQTYFLFEPAIANNLPHTLTILAIIFIVLGVLGVLLISTPDQPSQAPAESPSSKRTSMSSQHDVGTDHRVFYKSRAFWMLYAIAHVAAITSYFSSLQYKSYGLLIINDDDFMSLVGSLTGLANMLARIFWAATLQTFTFPISLAIILSLNAICIISLLWVTSHFWYATTFVIMQFAAGGLFTIFAPELIRRWGSKQAPKFFAIFGTANNTALIFNVLIGKVGVGLIGYLACFKALFLTAMGAIGLLYILIFIIDAHEKNLKKDCLLPDVSETSERFTQIENSHKFALPAHLESSSDASPTKSP